MNARPLPGRVYRAGLAGVMTSTSEVLAALPPFQVMSRVDLKVVAGGFKDSWKLGKGLRYVALAVRHPPSHARMPCSCPLPFLADRGVSRRLDRERILPRASVEIRETALGRAAGGSCRVIVKNRGPHRPSRAILADDTRFIHSFLQNTRSILFRGRRFPPSSFVTSPGGARTRARSRPYPWR